MPTSYIVRQLSRKESRDFKDALRRARGDGHTMRWVVARLVRLYAHVGLDRLEECAAPRRIKPVDYAPQPTAGIKPAEYELIRALRALPLKERHYIAYLTRRMASTPPPKPAKGQKSIKSPRTESSDAMRWSSPHTSARRPTEKLQRVG